eukprot:807323-Pelagomonas_calceolata.AAC.3
MAERPKALGAGRPQAKIPSSESAASFALIAAPVTRLASRRSCRAARELGGEDGASPGLKFLLCV